MTKHIVSIATFLIASLNCLGQDTIRVETSTLYSSDKEPMRGKEFAFRAKYSREDVVFSDNHKRIEYCYYYDNERNCFGTNYQLTNHSTIIIDKKIWNYKKQTDRYFVERNFDGTYEFGYTKSLIPFETTGLFTTTTADKIDTLWTTDYTVDIPSRPYDKPLWTFHKTKIKGKIYAKDKIEEPPTFLNGDTLKTIHLNRIGGCYGEIGTVVRELKFVITKEGRIVNIEQSIGNIDLFCPYYLLDLMRYLTQKGQLNPAKLKGQNVNVLWTLKVEINDD